MIFNCRMRNPYASDECPMSNYDPYASLGCDPKKWVLGAPERLGPMAGQILDHELLHTMQDFHFCAFSSWQARMANPVGMFARVPFEFFPTVLGDPLLKGPLIGGMFYGSARLADYVNYIFYEESESL